MRSRELTSAQLTQLADTLKTVERELPDSGTALTNETMRIGFLISEVDEQFSQLVWRREWRWAMFPRKTIADAFRRRDDELQRIKGIDQMDFKAAKEELERISNESFAMRNTVVHESEINFKSFLISRREVLTRLRLLQAATTFLVSGESVPIADPFGDKLFLQANGKTTRIWSIGQDAKNDGGRGELFGGPDMVIEVPQGISVTLTK